MINGAVLKTAMELLMSRLLVSLPVVALVGAACSVSSVDTPADSHQTEASLSSAQENVLLHDEEANLSEKLDPRAIPFIDAPQLIQSLQRDLVIQASVDPSLPRVAVSLPTPVSHDEAERNFTIKGVAPLPIFLNRNGGTYFAGGNDSSRNISSVVSAGSATLSAFPYNDAGWNLVVDCVRAQFSPFNVTVTDVEPSSGQYVEAVIGGSPTQVGLPNGVGGVAPIDSFGCSTIPSAVVYTFVENLPADAQVICEVAAQEIAHALSLDHAYLCQDPMTYLSGCGAKSFQDINASCGEYSPRACICGRPSQNSVQTLIDKVGAAQGQPVGPPDTTAPRISFTSPNNGSTLPANTTMQVVVNASDDRGINTINLEWDFTGDVFPCPSQSNAVTCSRSGSLYTWQINVGTGNRTFRAVAVDAAGNSARTSDRTVSLVEGAEPPAQNTAPVVNVVSPSSNASLPANSTISVVATADDAQSAPTVELLWLFTNDVFPCPFEGGGVTCTQQGNQSTWNINVGTGTREFQVRATDTDGNVTTSDRQQISLVDLNNPNPTPVTDDSLEPNNGSDVARPFACNSSVDLTITAQDQDWFTVDTPVGTGVTITLDGQSAADLDLYVFGRSDGISLGASESPGPDENVQITGPSGGIYVATQGAQGATGPYRLTVSCEGAANPDAGTPNPNPDAGNPNPNPDAGTPNPNPDAGSSNPVIDAGDKPREDFEQDDDLPGVEGGCTQSSNSQSNSALSLVGLLGLILSRKKYRIYSRR